MAFDYNDAVFATPLIRAIKRNNQEEVKETLDQGYSANLPDNRGWTPVHEAATDETRRGCLRELLQHKSANINSQTFLGETPIYLACQNQCIKTVKILLNHPKCNINLADNEGVSPLHVASSVGNLLILKLLVEYGAKVNSQDCEGYTPLHEVVSSASGPQSHKDDVCFEICQYLLNHGANCDIVETEGNHPFHLACQNGLVKTLSLLHSASKQRDLVNLCNNDGRSPLMMAVPSKMLPAIEALLSLGANCNIADKFNVLALHLAVHTAHFDIFQMIFKATSKECILRYCTFDEERDFEEFLHTKRINSLVCLAIDTEDLTFLTQLLECDFDRAVFQCPVIHAENLRKKSFTLHTPVSFLLESKMLDLGERTIDFLHILIEHGLPLKVKSKSDLISYINPICAGLVALNDCLVEIVMKCLRVLLANGADPDEPYGRMPFAIEQSCMRDCPEAMLLLLQNSNVVEPEDVIKWVEHETSSNQERIVKLLLSLSPYYIPCNKLLPDLSDNSVKRSLLAPCVHSLASYCRSVVRRQLHTETKASPHLFKQKLQDLAIPKELYYYLSYL